MTDMEKGPVVALIVLGLAGALVAAATVRNLLPEVHRTAPPVVYAQALEAWEALETAQNRLFDDGVCPVEGANAALLEQAQGLAEQAWEQAAALTEEQRGILASAQLQAELAGEFPQQHCALQLAVASWGETP